MAHLICKAELVHCRCGVTAADDRCCIRISQRLCYSNRTFCKDRVLKYAHRTVPYNCLSGFHSICIEFCCLCTDIQPHLICRDCVGGNYLHCDLSVDRVREICSDRGVYREQELFALFFCFCHHLFTVIQLLFIHQRCTDLIAFCFQECISHAAADNQGIAFLQQVIDHIQLIRNFCTAEDRYERPYRIFYRVAEEVDLFLHQITNRVLSAFFLDELCHAFHGCMCSVGRAECVTYIQISQFSQFLAELFAVLCLFFSAETCILQKNYVSLLHCLHCLCCSFASYIVIRNKVYLLAQFLGKPLCHRCKRFSFVGAVLYFAEVGAKDHLAAVSDQFVDRGKRCYDTGLICDSAVFQRHIKVAPYQHAFSLYINIIYGFLI